MMTSEFNTKEGRKWVKSLLHEGEVTIFFTKKDGTERELRCTLAENKIPQEKLPKNSGKSKSDDALAVFDVEKDAWRSFRWDSVTKVDFNFTGK